MSWLEKAKKLAAEKIFVLEQADQETANMRWDTCWHCDKMEHEKKICTICGCYIEIKIWAKTSRSPARPMGEVTHCPLGKWNDLEITNYYRAEDGKEPL